MFVSHLVADKINVSRIVTCYFESLAFLLADRLRCSGILRLRQTLTIANDVHSQNYDPVV